MKLLLLCLWLLAQSSSWATTIQFAELGTAPLTDANGVYIQGVHFRFASGQAFFNEGIGTVGTAVLSIDPVLAGPTAGILTLTFDQPTPWLQFNILLESIFTIDDSNQGPNGGPAYTVLLSNGLNLAGGTTPQPNGVYSEGTFLYSGTPIDSASITFFHGHDTSGMTVSTFGVDNLTFGTPEPASFVGLGTGLILIGAIRRRRNGSGRRGN